MQAWEKREKGKESPLKQIDQSGVVAHAFDPSTWESEAGGSL